MRDLTVEYRPIEALTPYGRNPRTHSKKQIRQLADSIKTFGWTNPILTDDEGGVIAGHGRLEAARVLGLESVPTIRVSDMSDAQKRAYVMADNKLAENAGWDRDLLRVELSALFETDLDFSIETIGFETAEIDLILGDEAVCDDADRGIPPVSNGPSVTEPGDLWIMGEHRLYCGDALDFASYAALLEGEKAAAVFTDPPYNVPVDGHVCGKGAVRHREFAMASGEMSSPEFERFLGTLCDRLIENSVDGSIHFICIDWRHAHELLSAASSRFAELKNICVWNKTNGGMGSLYRSKHEFVFVYKNGRAPHQNNVELGRHGRYRTNVWDYAGVNAFGAERLADLSDHPTVKPLRLVADAICDVTRRGELVLDPFAGSGTTILAAEKTGRRGAAIELDPAYVDVAIRRFEAATDLEARHAFYGHSFKEIALNREFDRSLKEEETT